MFLGIQLMASKKGLRKTFSISVVIIIVLVIFSIVGTVSIIALSKSYSESAIHSLAEDIILRTITDSAEHVNLMLAPAVNVVNLLENEVPEGASIYDDEDLNEDLVNQMIRTLQHNQDVYTLYYANEQGEFFLVGKRQRFEDDKKLYFFHKRITVKEGIRTVTETWYDGLEKLDTVLLDKDIYNPKSRPWYKKAHAENSAVWTSPYIFFITKLPGITFAKPVIYRDVFVGVIASDLEISTISKFMMESVFTKNTNIFALDGYGNVLAHSSLAGKYEDKVSLKHKIPKVSDMGDKVAEKMNDSYSSTDMRAVKNISLNDEDYKTIMAPFNLQGLNVLLGMYTPARDYLAPLYKSYEAVAVIACIILFLTVIISRNISKHLARPFEELSKATESAKELKFDKQINIRTNFKEVSATQNNFNQMLESLANYQSANEVLSETLHNAHIDTLYRLAMAAEHKDQYTYDHLKRVSDISVMVAEVYGLSVHDTELIRNASAMHDVGKLGIPDHILMKPGKLTTNEFDIIKTHSLLGGKILENPSSEEMHASMVIALAHHEKWNGLGYPNNLRGEDIPLYGRIVSIADVIDALLSKRPYKEAYSFEKTISIIEMEKGEHFDPELTDLVLENQPLLKKIVS